MIASPTALFHFLETIQARPKKSLSQNFLIDRNILDKIVAEANVSSLDRILEIGAGPGALTEILLEKGAFVVAVEKDDKFAKALGRFQGLEIFHGDILDFPFKALSQKMKVVANLPYHLTSPILGLLLENHSLFSSITVMVQEEVARRMVALPGSSEYSSLSVFLQFYSTPKYAFKVKRRSFFPTPAIDSAVVTLEMKETLPPIDAPHFFSFVKQAFQQRRKMLRSSLKEVPALKLGKFSQERPENVSLSEWLKLYQSNFI